MHDRRPKTEDGRRNIKSLFFVAILSVISFSVCAQAELNYQTVEDSSYALYLKKDWKGLEQFGRLAIKNKIDYFYLRERIGIAYYEQKKYQLALPHFQKAYGFNSGDELLQEYLFYSHVFNYQYDQALHLTKKFSPELKTKTYTTKPAAINMVQLDFTAKIPELSSIAYPYYFFGFGFNHRITRGYSAFHAYSFSRQKYNRGIYDQHRYYLSVNIPLVKGFSLIPAFSILADQYKDTLFYPPPPPPMRPPPPSLRTRTYLSYIGSLNVSMALPYVKVDLGNAFSNLDTTYQIQHALALTVYPLANQKLFIGATGILYTNNYYSSVKPLVQAVVGFNAPQFFRMSVVYTYANIYNFHLYNGYWVQNGYDLLRHNVTASPEFIIKHRFSIYAAYQLELKTTRTTQTNYIAHGVSFGTKLRF
jgi:hypothetical protein